MSDEDNKVVTMDGEPLSHEHEIPAHEWTSTTFDGDALAHAVQELQRNQVDIVSTLNSISITLRSHQDILKEMKSRLDDLKTKEAHLQDRVVNQGEVISGQATVSEKMSITLMNLQKSHKEEVDRLDKKVESIDEASADIIRRMS